MGQIISENDKFSSFARTIFQQSVIITVVKLSLRFQRWKRSFNVAFVHFGSTISFSSGVVRESLADVSCHWLIFNIGDTQRKWRALSLALVWFVVCSCFFAPFLRRPFYTHILVGEWQRGRGSELHSIGYLVSLWKPSFCRWHTHTM